MLGGMSKCCLQINSLNSKNSVFVVGTIIGVTVDGSTCTVVVFAADDGTVVGVNVDCGFGFSVTVDGSTIVVFVADDGTVVGVDVDGGFGFGVTVNGSTVADLTDENGTSILETAAPLDVI